MENIELVVKGYIERNWSGRLLPAGLYSYRIDSTDTDGNRTLKEMKGLRIDTRVPTVRITLSSVGASPNNDGINNFITLNLYTDLPEEISRRSVEFIDKKGTLIKTLSSTALNTALPARLDWNGLSEKNELVQSASDYAVQ